MLMIEEHNFIALINFFITPHNRRDVRDASHTLPHEEAIFKSHFIVVTLLQDP